MNITTVPLRTPLFRRARRLRVMLVGMPNAGKSALFRAVSSVNPRTRELAGTQLLYRECTVQTGFDQARVIDLPSIRSLQYLEREDLATLDYLLWGEARSLVSAYERQGPAASSAPPELIVQVIDATQLASHLELTLELLQLRRPLVVALNRIDEAQAKGLYINAAALSVSLGLPVVPTVASMGQGIDALFSVAFETARAGTPADYPLASRHLWAALQPLHHALARPEIEWELRAPAGLLLMEVAAGDPHFCGMLRRNFPTTYSEVARLIAEVEQKLPRPLAEELHADRHHRAALLFEAASRLGVPREGRDWRYWLDELFLHPRWGLIGSLGVFAAVLFVVLEVSAWLDALTAARLVAWAADWQPRTLTGVIGRAVADGAIGLIGIVIPYMIPLVLLLVALEETGIMQRIAFVVDRAFHQIGLHGGVALSFMLGLGCNVPALSAAAKATRGRERIIASVLITFVPCSARSAIILAVGGKYLGAAGIMMIFALTLAVMVITGRFLVRCRGPLGPGQVQGIPTYRLPTPARLCAETWARTKDILTIVTPLLLGGSVVLALLKHAGADAAINAFLAPVTAWWLGLPVALGVPILFGVLRKELSLLMVYQALATLEIGAVMDAVQIATFLLFLTFYFPCVSTFAVMLKTIGHREALVSAALSVAVALLVGGAVRLALGAGYFVWG